VVGKSEDIPTLTGKTKNGHHHRVRLSVSGT
jgi:hypothetical protein